MKLTLLFVSSVCIFLSCTNSVKKVEQENDDITLVWNKFTPQVFNDAKSQNKLIYLHVGAQWCHWCHVMEDSTYADAEVQTYLNENFILAKEDQDSRPDLFTKYRSFGWPALIVFDQNANEILKLRGYQERKKFLALIKKAVENPQVISNENPEEESSNTSFTQLSYEELLSLFVSKIDFEKGAYKTYKKSLHSPGIQMALAYAKEFDSIKTWLHLSIQNSFQLMDSAWGGIFQYATHFGWKNAHYERLLRVQAEHILNYTRYSSIFEDSVSLKKAEKIYAYCNEFLSMKRPLFNNSQDADYKKGTESTSYYALSNDERRKLGVPITHEVQFLKENAMMVNALIQLWAATSNEKYYVRAENIFMVLQFEFKNENGLYTRNTTDTNLFSLDDNVSMLNATILAAQISGQKKLIIEAENLAQNILEKFTNQEGSLNSVVGDLTLEPDVLGSSNMNAAFVIQHLALITKNEVLQKAAEDLAEKTLQTSSDFSEYFIPYRLLKTKYMDEEPLHAVFILEKSGTKLEKEMLQKLIAFAQPNLIIDRVYKSKMTVEQELLYGSTESGILFICNSSFCSSPIKDPNEIRSVLIPENKNPILQEQHGVTNSALRN
jgi:uncharacterized protein YyaL (SSP411 family)